MLRRSTLICLALLAALAAFPLIAPLLGLEFYVNFVRRVLIVALAAASLNFILGFGGLVALGHAGFIGVGAYTVVALTEAGFSSAWLLWPAAMAVAAAISGLIALVVLRTRGVYFIMSTLAFAQMLYFCAVALRAYGGDDGYTLMSRPALLPGLDLGHEPTFYWVVLALVAPLLWLMHRATRARFGHALMGIRDNETRMRALGYPVLRLQWVAFVAAGAVAGLAGALLAAGNNFVSPATMHWTQSATLVVMVVIGGMGRSWGGPVGAAVWLLLEELLKLHAEYWHLPLGVLLVAVALWAPRGLAALGQRKVPVLPPLPLGEGGGEGPATSTPARADPGRAAPLPTSPQRGEEQGAPLFRIDGLVKRFGGLLATDHVDLSLAPGEVHALIGPNGAGKTTLINQITGLLKPDAGRLWLAGRDITALADHQRVAAGLSRCFQVTRVFARDSVQDNLVLALQAHAGSSLRFFAPRAHESALYAQARELAARVGLGEVLAREAGTLPHGAQRALDVALALAAKPRLLLLDEPMAGMGPEESARMVELIESLRGNDGERCAVLLVEHDMDAVFRLADRVTVLVQGRVLTTGTVDAVRADARVQAVYLGTEDLVSEDHR